MPDLLIESGLGEGDTPLLESPIVSNEVDSDPSHISEALAAGVTLADLTGLRVLRLQGTPVAEGDSSLRALEIGQVIVLDEGWCALLAADEALALFRTEAPEPLATVGDMLPAPGGLLTLTDESHGLGTIVIAGGRARALLRKLTGLDVSERRLPDLRAAQTSLANVHARLLRIDRGGHPTYLVLVERSVAEYVWQVLREAAAEFEHALIDGRLWLEAALP